MKNQLKLKGMAAVIMVIAEPMYAPETSQAEAVVGTDSLHDDCASHLYLTNAYQQAYHIRMHSHITHLMLESSGMLVPMP